MKIIKYKQFINEELNDTPENYISTALTRLKREIDNIFENSIKKSSRKKPDMSLSDLGVRLETSDISKYSKLYDSLTVKFSDDSNTYTLIIIIDIKEAIPKDDTKDFDIDDIKNAYIKFKKYDLDTFEVIGQISKNVKLKDINEDFLINIKIELDEKFGEDDNEFEIET
jgi:hypothetical protein